MIKGIYKLYLKLISSLISTNKSLVLFFNLLPNYREINIEKISHNRLINFINNHFIYIAYYCKNKNIIYKDVNYNHPSFTLRLNVNDYTSALYYFGVLNIPLLNLLQKGGGTILDIGSNVGLYSIYASNYFTNVYSFEPIEENYKNFISNISLSYQTYQKNINVNKIALSDVNGDCKMLFKLKHSGSSTLETREIDDNDDDYTYQNIRTVKLDDFVHMNSDIQNIDFIKIDVEGHELSVIRGGLEVVNRFKPSLYIEVNSNRKMLADIIELLPDFYIPYNPYTSVKMSSHTEEIIPTDILFLTSN
jgi:FkbM family methyltransferase